MLITETWKKCGGRLVDGGVMVYDVMVSDPVCASRLALLLLLLLLAVVGGVAIYGG